MIPDNVLVSENLGQDLRDFLSASSYSKVGVLVDENTETHCLPHIIEVMEDHWLIRIASGEEKKNIATCEQIWGALTEASFDRKSLLINLGGGVIGDMGGFCAATYKRGIDFVNLPTTLLSQVDASVGGKLGIDFHGLKNHIGSFQDPRKILVYPEFLHTLSKAELRSGYAEIIKHCLIADAEHWRKISKESLEEQDWKTHVIHSIGIKAAIVEQDPYERGLRKLLNFGHTIGHAIESTFLETENKLLHGEAIAIGMICESYLSTKKAGLPETDLEEIVAYIREIYGLHEIGKNYFDEIVKLCGQDKKNLGNVINCTLLKRIGEGMIDIPISTGEVLDSIFYYNHLNK